MNAQQHNFPPSFAIAGGWGYIGQKFMRAALHNNVHVWVLDPGNVPEAVDLNVVKHVHEEQEFLQLPASIYHLALHPYHRPPLLHALLERSNIEPGLPILIEKPMASWDKPSKCDEVCKRIESSKAFVLYDFLELFDPMTDRIITYLKQFKQVTIQEIVLKRSKDREDPAIPRNYIPMQPIQYQESCHCLAFLLFVLGNVAGSYEMPISIPVKIRAESQLYDSPAPERFPIPVDGRCEADIQFGEISVQLLTDFKRGAPWQKRKTIKGVGDGAPFEIEAEYLERAKWLTINGEDQGFDASADSYENALAKIWQMANSAYTTDKGSDLYPNASFARWIYTFSALLHHSCTVGETVQIDALSAYKLC